MLDGSLVGSSIAIIPPTALECPESRPFYPAVRERLGPAHGDLEGRLVIR